MLSIFNLNIHHNWDTVGIGIKWQYILFLHPQSDGDNDLITKLHDALRHSEEERARLQGQVEDLSFRVDELGTAVSMFQDGGKKWRRLCTEYIE